MIMIVKKFVTVETQVEIQVDAEDILESLAHLKDYHQKVVPAILSINTFLSAIQDETIAEMPVSVRNCISGFLNQSAKRFNPITPRD